jgi:hypothetical protein
MCIGVSMLQQNSLPISGYPIVRAVFPRELEWMRAASMRPVRIKSTAICRRCKSTGLDRSRVRAYETWRKWVSPKRPFRCNACQRRRWLSAVATTA